VTAEDRKKYWEKYQQEKQSRDVLAGGDCQTIFLMDNPGGTDVWYGNFRQWECDRCGKSGVQMACFDNSCDEYTPVCLCGECMWTLAVMMYGSELGEGGEK